jgi:hypothetical protein
MARAGPNEAPPVEQRDREERGKRREEDTTVAMSALKFCGKW